VSGWSSVDDLEDWTRVALEQLGAFVRAERRARHLTQQRLAERSGLSQSTISRLENGLAPGLRLGWFARVLVGFQEGIGEAGRWPRQWTEESRERLLAYFAPDGRLRQQIVHSEVARQDAFAEIAAMNIERQA
jgi:helix-turn-helix protein